MKPLLHLAAHSAWNRRATLSLVVLSIALASLLLLSLERMREDIRASFSQSVSGTDLVMGARTGSVQLMLYAVFRIGAATNNVRMASIRGANREGQRPQANLMQAVPCRICLTLRRGLEAVHIVHSEILPTSCSSYVELFPRAPVRHR